MERDRIILVTGGAGYIGSHTCKRLKQCGYLPIVYDNLTHGHEHAVKWGPLVIGDIRDRPKVEAVIEQYKPEAVIHFAAFAYVGESVEDPAKYYENNVVGTLSLFEAMRAKGLGTIVFSSTCATYGMPDTLPIKENHVQAPINPYGRSKLMIELVLGDYARAFGFRFAALRYFNACGADPDGEIGEEHDPETHLIPRALMAAAGEINQLDVFGDDYPTPDGTCIRDYIHVQDLARGHVMALEYLKESGESCQVNLGTGRGVSIKEVLQAVEQATGRTVPTKLKLRRPGDPPVLYADPSRAKSLFGFKAEFDDVAVSISTAWMYYNGRRCS